MSYSVTYLCPLRDHYKELHNPTMVSLSSPLALKGQLKLNTTKIIFLAVFLLTLTNTSCEARHLLVRGEHSSNLPSLPPKDVREVYAIKEKMIRLSMVVRVGSNFDASMHNNEMTALDVKTKAVALSGASCDSLRKRIQGIKARSGMRERSVLGDTKSEQHVVSNATTVYTAETLVVMDYLEAHPAPAVHNK